MTVTFGFNSATQWLGPGYSLGVATDHVPNTDVVYYEYQLDVQWFDLSIHTVWVTGPIPLTFPGSAAETIVVMGDTTTTRSYGKRFNVRENVANENVRLTVYFLNNLLVQLDTGQTAFVPWLNGMVGQQIAQLFGAGTPASNLLTLERLGDELLTQPLADSTVHAGVTGNQWIGINANTVALDMQITTLPPGVRTIGTTPVYYLGLGFLTPYDGVRYMRSQRIVFTAQRFKLPRQATQVALRLLPGLVMTLTEKVRLLT